MKKFLLAFFVIFAFIISVIAQKNKPNFSGTWDLDKSRSIFAEGLKLFSVKNNQLDCSAQIIIRHKEPKLNVKKTLRCYEKNNPQISSIATVENAIFYTDGRGEKNNIPDYMILSTKTTWSGWKIIIRNRLDSSVEEYALSDEGETLIEKTYNISNNLNLSKSSTQSKQELIYNLLNN